METLNTLEKKVVSLIERIRELKAENEHLLNENMQLLAKLETVEKSMLSETKRSDDLDQEKALTKLMVDDLIKSIDMLVEKENVP